MNQQLIRRVIERPNNVNKYDFGHLLIIGGSPGTVGAPLLAAMAALRVGAGMVTIAAYPEVADKLEKRVLEVMTLHLPRDEHLAVQVVGEYIARKKVSAVAIGPGLLPPDSELSAQLVPILDVPVVLDAGAVTCFGGNLPALAAAASRNPDIIVTPHDGEYQKTTGQVLPTEPEARAVAASTFARANGVTLVTKGYYSFVAHPGGSVYREQSGNPGLAKAGTGDVLTGIIAGLLAQDIATPEAADLGVHIQAVAGDLAARTKTEAGIVASDVAELIPQAMQHVANENPPA